MVLPELQTSPVCAENADCFKTTNTPNELIYSKKDHSSFTSKFITDSNSFTCDENVSKNEQDIYKSPPPYDTQDTELDSKSTIANTDKKWIQLAGHEQSFFLNSTKPGIILKKNEQNESTAYKKLNETNDQIVEFIPKFYSVIRTDDGQFIELQDLLTLFDSQCNIMDIKMGCRTFLENDVSNIRARPDLYEKLIKIDSSAATQDEHQLKAITKLRYVPIANSMFCRRRCCSTTVCVNLKPFIFSTYSNHVPG